MATCTPHQLTNIIKGHTDALIALGAKYMSEYAIVDPTKCLNSAVSLLFLLLGDDALANTKYCDVTTVTKRYERENPSLALAQALADQLKSPAPENERDVFYCMITDAWLADAAKPGVTRYFCGHVFIVERSHDAHSVFQSYIKQYDLDGYLTRTAQHVRDKSDLDALADGIVTLFSRDVWDADCTKFWRNFTMIDAKGFEGYVIKDKILFCYRRISLHECIGSLRRILETTLATIKNSKDDAFFTGKTGMTIGEMKKHLTDMLAQVRQ